MADPARVELIRLCERVLACAVEREDLQREWSDEASGPELADLRETLFAAVEHRRGYVVDGVWTVDPAASRRMIAEYDIIEFYVQRLRRASQS